MAISKTKPKRQKPKVKPERQVDAAPVEEEICCPPGQNSAGGTSEAALPVVEQPLAPTPSERIIHADLIDLLAMFHCTQRLGSSHPNSQGSQVKTNFRALLATLKDVRERLCWPAAQATIAYAASDPDSNAQQRFLNALREAGVTAIEEVDFRDCFVNEVGKPYYADKCPSSLGPNLAYTLGLLAGRSEASNENVGARVLVVSGVFDFSAAAKDFVTPRRKGTLAIVWPQTYLDSRWKSSRLLEGRGIRLEDLERYNRDEQIWGVKIKREQPRSEGLAAL